MNIWTDLHVESRESMLYWNPFWYGQENKMFRYQCTLQDYQYKNIYIYIYNCFIISTCTDYFTQLYNLLRVKKSLKDIQT